jgi:hypothetical protein
MDMLLILILPAVFTPGTVVGMMLVFDMMMDVELGGDWSRRACWASTACVESRRGAGAETPEGRLQESQSRNSSVRDSELLACEAPNTTSKGIELPL